MVVILVVLTKSALRFSFLISQLLAKAIPVRGARFKKPAFEAGFLLSEISDRETAFFNIKAP
ncbi:hypothetical protein [Klebsiella oxytoca]|uniref:hypothetical protein n=1 Tax=Klebsiella oxytoca TaxID=571 RepID=UPI003F671D6F